MASELAQDIGGIGMALNKKWIEPTGFEIGRERGFEIALVFEDIAEIGMGGRKARVERNGFFGTFDRCVEPPCGAQDGGEIGIGLGIVRLASDGLVDAFGGGRVVSADMFDEPNVMPGDGIARVLREHLRVEIARNLVALRDMEFERAARQRGYGWFGVLCCGKRRLVARHPEPRGARGGADSCGPSSRAHYTFGLVRTLPVSGDDVGSQLVFDAADLVAQDQFALL